VDDISVVALAQHFLNISGRSVENPGRLERISEEKELNSITRVTNTLRQKMQKRDFRGQMVGRIGEVVKGSIRMPRRSASRPPWWLFY